MALVHQNIFTVIFHQVRLQETLQNKGIERRKREKLAVVEDCACMEIEDCME
jgi:hypothetical protein